MDYEVEYLFEYKWMYYLIYCRNFCVVIVVWGLLLVCFVILNVVVFIQFQWVGDIEIFLGVGFFGLYEYCEWLQVGGEYSCCGDFMDFVSLINDLFCVVSMLVGVCNFVFIFFVVCLLFFCFLKVVIVLKICGVLQVIGCKGLFIYNDKF